MKLQAVVSDKPVDNVHLYDSLLDYFPWIKNWRINVSGGLTYVLGELFNDIEEILGKAPEIKFLRIVEEPYSDEMFMRELYVFIEPDVRNAANSAALAFAISKAKQNSKQLCFKCGCRLKHFREIDEQQVEMFLDKFSSSESHSQFMHFCVSCMTKDYGSFDEQDSKNYSDVDDEIDDAFINDNDSSSDDSESQDEVKEHESKDEVEVLGVPYITIYSMDAVDKLEADYKGGTREHVHRVKNLVKKMRENSNKKRLALIPEKWRSYCENLEKKFPNFSEVVLFIRNQIALSAAGDKELSFPPFLLVGDPGIGKTEFMMTVSHDFNTTLEIIDIAGAQSGSALSGSENFWGNTKPGLLFNTLVLGDVANPIVMLDEIDKARNDDVYKPLAALHALLEPRQARQFKDLSVPEVKFDASHIIWIATANSLEAIERPIVDRFTVFHIDVPSIEQMREIVKNQYQRFIDQNKAGGFFERKIRDDVLIDLCSYHPRNVRKILELSFGLAAYEQRNYLTVDDIHTCKTDDNKSTGIGFMS